MATEPLDTTKLPLPIHDADHVHGPATADYTLVEYRDYQCANGGRLFTDAAASYERLVNDYLSEAHRDHPGTGCPVGALAGDIARSDKRTRAVVTKQIAEQIELLANLIRETVLVQTGPIADDGRMQPFGPVEPCSRDGISTDRSSSCMSAGIPASS
jgi:hypothetical protein